MSEVDTVAVAGDVGVQTPASSATFALWVGPHLSVLAAIAVREVGAGDAEDVVQETLVRAWRRRRTFDATRGSVRGWLVAILLDRARRHRTRSRPAGLVDVVPPAVGDAADGRIDLERAVATLPTRQREVITLFYLADLPLTEVARVLGLSEGTVKSHLHDARTSLRSRLETP